MGWLQDIWDEEAAMGGAAAVPFTITFLTGTLPATVVLGSAYTGPATPALAEYDAGDGNWTQYTSKTITRAGNYIAFRGDWRTSAGGYYGLLNGTLNSTAYTCSFSGQLEETPSNFASCYREIFRDCKAVVLIEDNPLPILTGAPAANMFYIACYNMSNVTGSLPAGFLDTSGLTGAPATNMFQYACSSMSNVTSLPAGFMNTSGLTGAPATNMFGSACQNMSNVTSLPAGFMNTSGLTGAPAASMFHSACSSMSNVSGSLPAGFLDTSGLTGAPAANMFNAACFGMSNVTGGDIAIGANITLTSANVVGPLTSMMQNMPNWTGNVYWGAQPLTDQIANPDSDINTFAGNVLMPGYADMGANWK